MPLLSLPTQAGAGTCPGDLESFCKPLSLPCVQHMGHLCSIPARARARNIHLCYSRSQGGGKRSAEEDTKQEAAVPQGGDEDPSPKPCVSLHAHLPGLHGTLLGTAGSSGALPGWLLEVQFVHVTPGLRKG